MTLRAVLSVLALSGLAAGGGAVVLGLMAGHDVLSLSEGLSQPLALVLAAVGMGGMMLRRCSPP